MFKFHLEELTVDGLRKLADHLGIPKATTNRDELLQALKSRMAAGAEIVLGQQSPPWYRTPAILISMVAVLIAFAAMCSNWYSIHVAIGREHELHDKERIQRWQEVIVYKIIAEGTKTGERTISFDEISKSYVTAATQSDFVELKKEELQPLTLHRILQNLIALQLVFQTLDDKYAIQRSSLNPRADRAILEEQAKYEILNLLSREGGKHTYLELSQIITDRRKISNEEYNTIMNQLMASNLVLVGADMKLWSISSVPRKQP